MAEELDALTRRAEKYAIENAVTRETAATYHRLWRNIWEPFCESHGWPSLEAPPAAFPTLFDDARTGSLRRTNGAGMVSPAYVDTVLAAVRYCHLCAGRVPPQAAPGAPAAIAALRRRYATEYGKAGDERADAVSPPMTLGDFQALCTHPTTGDGWHLVTQAATLLCLDHGLTVPQVARLSVRDVVTAGDHCVVRVGGDDVRVPCRHAREHGIAPVCLACLLRDILTFQADCEHLLCFPGTRTEGEHDDRHRARLDHRVRQVAIQWPRLTFSRGRLQFRPLALDNGNDVHRLLTGTRLGATLGVVPGGLVMLRTRTAMKLATVRGLTGADLFTRLHVGDATITEREAVLRVAKFVGGRDRSQDAVAIRPQPDPRLCPVTGLLEWMLVRDAGYPRPAHDDEPLFVSLKGKWSGPARPLGIGAANAAFRELQRLAGIEPVHTLASLRDLSTWLMTNQGATEDQLLVNLRLKKPEQALRHAERAGGRGRRTSRLVAAETTAEEPGS